MVARLSCCERHNPGKVVNPFTLSTQKQWYCALRQTAKVFMPSLAITWQQILFHIHRTRNLPTVVLDEPEVYLHSDLQRRLVRLLEETGRQVVLATHSSELIGEVQPQSILLVDGLKDSARRIKGAQGFEKRINRPKSSKTRWANIH